MSKGFKITGPGRYETRGGEARIVVAAPYLLGDQYPWRSDESYPWHYREDGRIFANTDDKDDLIRRLPDPKPRKAKRKAKAQWGVWVPCKSRKEARAFLAGVNEEWPPVILGGKPQPATVRRLP